jgi:hypothetical protein
MGFGGESELTQSKHDPTTKPTITNTAHSLLHKGWGKTSQAGPTYITI